MRNKLFHRLTLYTQKNTNCVCATNGNVFVKLRIFFSRSGRTKIVDKRQWIAYCPITKSHQRNCRTYGVQKCSWSCDRVTAAHIRNAPTIIIKTSHAREHGPKTEAYTTQRWISDRSAVRKLCSLITTCVLAENHTLYMYAAYTYFSSGMPDGRHASRLLRFVPHRTWRQTDKSIMPGRKRACRPPQCCAPEVWTKHTRARFAHAHKIQRTESARYHYFCEAHTYVYIYVSHAVREQYVLQSVCLAYGSTLSDDVYIMCVYCTDGAAQKRWGFGYLIFFWEKLHTQTTVAGWTISSGWINMLCWMGYVLM